MKYTLNRIPSLNEFCVICDERHILETGLLRVIILLIIIMIVNIFSFSPSPLSRVYVQENCVCLLSRRLELWQMLQNL